jgi:glycosyltransferase involved in cell wall biosynthesis
MKDGRQSMKAVLVALSPSIGMQFYTAAVANALVRNGNHAVFVIGSAALRKNAFERDVTLLPAHVFSGTGVSTLSLNPFSFRRLLREIGDITPSVVHFTGPHLWNWPLALCLREQCPIVLTQHDAATHEGARGEWLKGVYRRAMIHSVDCVIVHSKAVRKALSDSGLVPAAISTMPMVHHNFDYALYQQIRARDCEDFAREDMVLLFGRLEEYKGVWEFLDAARILSKAKDDVQVTMVLAGTGRLSKHLDSYQNLPNLEIRNYLIDDQETVDLFGRAGLVILPYSEGSQSALIPLAYLFEKPVLVTRAGALPEYVRDGCTGRIITSNDPAILAEAIRDMFRDKSALIQMGRAGKEFFWELERQFAERLLYTYTTVTESRTP